MSITRGQFLRSLGKSLPGMVASTGVATAAHALIRRMAQAVPPDEPQVQPAPAPPVAEEPVPFLQKGPETGNEIALTFDDGPVPGVTERILDTLRAHDLRATFFLIGEKIGDAPDLARRILQEGHELGHHTYTHCKLTDFSNSVMEDELDRTDAIFMEILGRRADWFRPPFGALRQDQAKRVRKRGMRVALWSLDSEDWRGGPGEAVTERILTHLHPGAIILCHDVPATAESLDTTLMRMRQTQPYHARTLTELFKVGTLPS